MLIMAGREENRIFVGGLSAHTTERQLDDAFRRYGKILESVVRFFNIYRSICVHACAYIGVRC